MSRLTLIQQQVLEALVDAVPNDEAREAHPDRVREELRKYRPRQQSTAYVRRILRDLCAGAADPALARVVNGFRGTVNFVPTHAGYEVVSEHRARPSARDWRRGDR